MNFFSNRSLWEENSSFMFIKSKLEFRQTGKIFAFDLDGTLTTAKNGLDPKRYNDIDENNWIFLGPVKEYIESISEEYSIFIITNQANISHTKKCMIESVYKSLNGIPTVLCANKKNNYRKPNTGFIEVIRSLLHQSNIDLNQNESWYTGDAVGPNDSFVPYRWSSDDLNFAVNCGLKFIRPNEIFGHSSILPTEELVIMMGTPGSLKTTFAKGLETIGYQRYSQDDISGKIIDYIGFIERSLLSGNKIVLDATFPSDKSKIPFYEMVARINQRYGTNFKVHILWNIRNGSPWNNLRDPGTKVSHFAYTGKYGYVANFNDPYVLQSTYNYNISVMY